MSLYLLDEDFPQVELAHYGYVREEDEPIVLEFEMDSQRAQAFTNQIQGIVGAIRHAFQFIDPDAAVTQSVYDELPGVDPNAPYTLTFTALIPDFVMLDCREVDSATIVHLLDSLPSGQKLNVQGSYKLEWNNFMMLEVRLVLTGLEVLA